MQIPVDMVVNSIITAMVVNANKSHKIIYHVGTSLRNPLKFSDFNNFMFQYCTKNPWLYNDGSPVEVRKLKMVRTVAHFHLHMTIRSMLPLQVSLIVVFFVLFSTTTRVHWFIFFSGKQRKFIKRERKVHQEMGKTQTLPYTKN